jgi:hypothetical protein
MYLTIFGTLWLFVEPLGTFGLIPTLEKLTGFLLYFLLLVFPALVLSIGLRWQYWYRTHDLPFVTLSLRSSIDGVTYSLRVTENMQIGQFLSQFVEILCQGPAQKFVAAILEKHYPVLQVKRTESFVDIDSNLTLYAANIRDGDICQVRAQVYENQSRVMFSRG